MFSIQKLLGKDPKFFDLLEGAAKEASNCALALEALLKDPSAAANLHQVRQARQRSKEITEEISELAVKTFVTILEREDIEALSDALYKIPKPIEKFAERYLISREVYKNGHGYEQIGLIKQATSTVVEMVQTFRTGMNSERVSKLNSKLQTAEAEADVLELELLKSLYKSNKNPVEIIIGRDLYDLLEKVIDRCRDSGNVIVHICHKNS